MATLTFTPSNSAVKSFKPRVLTAKFGDGYEQRIRDGINNNPENWQVQFNNKVSTVADAIETFFNDHGGVNSFAWTAPGGVARTYICREWSRTMTDKRIHTITATFEQTYD